MTGLTSPTHLVLLLLLALLLFGAKRLPEIGRSVGHGMREFKDSVSGSEHERTAPAELASGDEIPTAHQATHDRDAV